MYTLIFQFDHRAKAKSRKRKIGDSSKAPEIPKSEEQVLVTPEDNIENHEEHHNKKDNPPHRMKRRPRNRLIGFS